MEQGFINKLHSRMQRYTKQRERERERERKKERERGEKETRVTASHLE